MANSKPTENEETDEREEELSEAQINELKIAFEVFDKDGNGFISSKELGAVMRSLGQNPTDTELHAMINEADINGDGLVNFEDFMLLMTQRLKVLDRDEGIREAFRAFDKEDKGSFDVAELRYVLSNIQEFIDIPKHEVEEICKEADITGSGTLNFEEFALLFET
ncbi:calmodulin-A-like [Patiria miniata]|uniref:EF-hand domain-containing protein n=1 Tax=Patiria miniata TaxID=46514 RepID=A0A913ZQS2_PATMI|nr:calmodulin-A-like [Patiria miniata]